MMLSGVALLVLRAAAAAASASASEHGSAGTAAAGSAAFWKGYPGAAISIPQVPPPLIDCHSAAGCVALKKKRLREFCSHPLYRNMPNCQDLYSCVPGGCGNGVCKMGYCRCNSGYMGPSCQTPVMYLPIGQEFNASHFAAPPLMDAPRPRRLGNSTGNGPTWTTAGTGPGGTPPAPSPFAAPLYVPGSPGSPTFTVADGGGPAAASVAPAAAGMAPAAAANLAAFGAPSPAGAPAPAAAAFLSLSRARQKLLRPTTLSVRVADASAGLAPDRPKPVSGALRGAR